MNQTSFIDQFVQRQGEKWDIRWKIATAIAILFAITLLAMAAVNALNVTQSVGKKALDPLVLEHVLARRYEETRIKEPASVFLSKNPELKIAERYTENAAKESGAAISANIQKPRISPAVLDNVMRRRYEENVLK